ncbi:MAG: zf-CGNR multi-domain protein [Dehalococcoidia bacterium]|nr:zf-CGNR multi-domain protein [Dehalococcoidia bacterium]
MPWPPRFLFIAGRLSIDFALTGGEGERAQWERWHTPEDFADWARACPLLAVDVRVERLDLIDARELREALWWGAQAVLRGDTVSREIQHLLSRFAEQPNLVPVMRAGEMHWLDPTAAQVFSSVSRDAIELFGTGLRSRLRECRNPICGLLFVDLSRPGKRLWCTMRRCGNLNKIARYRTGHGIAESND